MAVLAGAVAMYGPTRVAWADALSPSNAQAKVAAASARYLRFCTFVWRLAACVQAAGPQAIEQQIAQHTERKALTPLALS